MPKNSGQEYPTLGRDGSPTRTQYFERAATVFLNQAQKRATKLPEPQPINLIEGKIMLMGSNGPRLFEPPLRVKLGAGQEWVMTPDEHLAIRNVVNGKIVKIF